MTHSGLTHSSSLSRGFDRNVISSHLPSILPLRPLCPPELCCGLLGLHSSVIYIYYDGDITNVWLVTCDVRVTLSTSVTATPGSRYLVDWCHCGNKHPCSHVLLTTTRTALRFGAVRSTHRKVQKSYGKRVRTSTVPSLSEHGLPAVVPLRLFPVTLPQH